jgi:hypothetical protein
MHLTAASVLRLPRGSRLRRRYMEDWSGAWRTWRAEIEDVVEVARDKVLVTGRHIGEGLASGVEIALFSDRETVSELVRSIAENEPAGEGATARR